MSEVKDNGSTSKTLSTAAHRSFFCRKHRHKRSGSKDGKDLLSLDTFSSDSIPLFEESMSLAYQWVQKVDCTSLRPVLTLGPLLDKGEGDSGEQGTQQVLQVPASGDESLPASHQAGCQGLPVCGLQVEERPFRHDHGGFNKGDHRKEQALSAGHRPTSHCVAAPYAHLPHHHLHPLQEHQADQGTEKPRVPEGQGDTETFQRADGDSSGDQAGI
ncbi:Disks large-like protein 5 [Heterocephalus glaber]|uniref:Disks large-like protein 5 n=1 Tax=Heterocephalus glaber TaxID=10181 RepID=G5ANM5_HETGA|nr:Disks large-like protein 5 [Heterocephalus glaber]